MVEEIRYEMFEVLRSLSVRKRQGVLFVDGDRGTFEIVFSNGIIVEVTKLGESEGEAICERLVSGGYLDESFLDKFSDTELSTREARMFLLQTKRITSEQLRVVRKAYETDLLHSLRTLTKATFEFSPKIIEPSSERVLNITPGHLMVDFSEVESGQLTLSDETDQARAKGIKLVRNVEAAKVRFGSEEVLWSCLDAPITLEDLRWKALLSELEYVEGMLSLWKQGAVRLMQEKSEPAVLSERVASQALKEEAAEAKPTREGQEISNLKSDQARELIDQFALLLDQGDSESEVDLTLKPEEEIEDSVVFDEDSAESKPDRKSDSRPSKRFKSRARIQNPAMAPSRKWRDGNRINFEELNAMLLEPERREEIGIALGFLFLILLGIFLPGELNSWFAALSEFSSVSAFQHDTLEINR